MNEKEAMKPREAYRAYLNGEITASQAEHAVQTWYSDNKPSASAKPPQDG